MTLGNLGAVAAVASLIGCLVLAASRRWCPPGRPESIGLYALLDVVALVSLVFVPAVAAGG